MKQLSWQAVALIGILGLVALGLATMTDWGAGEIIGVVGVLAGVGSGAAVVGTVSGRVDQIAAETTEQSTTLATIQHKVNGDLDSRIAEHVATGNDLLIRELERRGVVMR